MEDVIFAGSTARRSVGMAEVSLIFDNATGLFALDYEEVVITRRVYRDGEGQYFINHAPCRLKDIQELFMDTGSGKEGFSIIGQGRVEEILNLKSEERRLLIEEVAGISKYRLRKKETLKKLDDTQQNVERLNDIITEVERRLEPLSQQAEVAKTSKKLQAMLEETEIRLVGNELFEINNKLITSKTALQELNQELIILTTFIAEEENVNMRGKYELSQMEESVTHLQGEVYELDNKVKEAMHTLSLVAERQRYGQEQLCRLISEIQGVEDKITQSNLKIISLKGKEAVLENKLREASKSLQDKDLHLTGLRDLSGDLRLDNLKSEIFEEMSNQSKLSNVLTEEKHQIATLKRQEEQVKENIGTKQTEKERLIQDISEQETEKNRIEKTLTELQQKLDHVKDHIDNKKAEHQSLSLIHI